MVTGLVYDRRFHEHQTGRGHPERPERLAAIVERLQSDGLWDRLVHVKFEPASLEWVTAVHDVAYVHRLKAACRAGHATIDCMDSAICPASYQVALLAVGGVLAAVDAVMRVAEGGLKNAFCAVRPPGHHAERDRSLGFCLFNNIAIAAEYLIRRHGLERVAIVDFDVHHGNGTQHTFEARRDVLFISIHEDPATLYPGTGFADERGIGEGEGYTINIPLEPGSGDDEYRRAFEQTVFPALERYQPQFLLVSAGFDASEYDPLAHMRVTAEGFLWMSRQLRRAADRLCQGRLVSVLEGGYDLGSLAECVSLHIQALMEQGDL